jgi:hypothetical protein
MSDFILGHNQHSMSDFILLQPGLSQNSYRPPLPNPQVTEGKTSKCAIEMLYHVGGWWFTPVIPATLGRLRLG